MNTGIPLVSICCTCFNHERYIAKALQSFVNQKTSFSYEIIVNDDASTDSSAQIIRKFASDYPDLVFPIYQRENQYSKKVNIVHDIILPRAKGKYIALCEGDDFWCDSQKLQIQFDYMESHPECIMCGHSNLEVDEKGKRVIGINRYSEQDTDIEVWNCFGNPVVHLSSYFIRKELFYSFSEIKKLCPVGDLSLCIEAASRYPIHYIDKPMSCYRRFSVSSWSRKMASSSECRKLHFSRLIEYFVALESVYPQYQQKLHQEISLLHMKEIMNNGDTSCLLGSNAFKSLSLNEKLKYYIKFRHGFLYRLLIIPRKIRHEVKKVYIHFKYKDKLV